MSLIYTI